MTQYFGLSTNFSPKFRSLGWKKKLSPGFT
jgi:hypothetical protein